MTLEFKVKLFVSDRVSNSFTDMMTRQESNTFNIWYKSENSKTFKKINRSFKTEEEANIFIERVLKVNSSLWYGKDFYRNGVLDKTV